MDNQKNKWIAKPEKSKSRAFMVSRIKNSKVLNENDECACTKMTFSSHDFFKVWMRKKI